MSGTLSLFGEAVDPRTGSMMGNYPLLFSQIEYDRAVMEIAKARPLSAAKVGQKLGGLVSE